MALSSEVGPVRVGQRVETGEDFQEATMTRWHDTMVDRPESDHEGGYAAGWTISGLAMLGAIVTVWVFAI
jgi:hypothetical protein